MTIEIPVKLYIKAYLEKHYGTPVEIYKNNQVGLTFYKLLNDQRHHQDSKIDLSYYKSVVTICVTEDVHFRHGSYLSKTGMRDFNQYMEWLIKDDACKFITTAVKYKPKIEFREAIADWLQENGLSEQNMPYQTIVKFFYRLRKRNGGMLRIRKSKGKEICGVTVL